jgi:hypothetical protein
MDLTPTPSQTIGPFFHLALTTDETLGLLAVAGATGEPIKLQCRVTDGDGVPLDDGRRTRMANTIIPRTLKRARLIQAFADLGAFPRMIRAPVLSKR